jgi:hypothetical protein
MFEEQFTLIGYRTSGVQNLCLLLIINDLNRVVGSSIRTLSQSLMFEEQLIRYRTSGVQNLCLLLVINYLNRVVGSSTRTLPPNNTFLFFGLM